MIPSLYTSTLYTVGIIIIIIITNMVFLMTKNTTQFTWFY